MTHHFWAKKLCWRRWRTNFDRILYFICLCLCSSTSQQPASSECLLHFLIVSIGCWLQWKTLKHSNSSPLFELRTTLTSSIISFEILAGSYSQKQEVLCYSLRSSFCCLLCLLLPPSHRPLSLINLITMWAQIPFELFVSSQIYLVMSHTKLKASISSVSYHFPLSSHNIR